MLHIVDQTDETSRTEISSEMFGANLTLTTDVSLRQDVLDRFGEAGITNLRYPGGTITETHFDISDIAGGSHNRMVGSYENSGDLDLIAFSDFMDLAASLGTSTTLVIPTSVGFTQSAGEALLAGTYGTRSLSADYLADVADFVAMAMREAGAMGVTVDAFEIGNEFWASGRMTAQEYGNLAAAVSQTIETTLLDLGLHRADQPDIVVQTLSSAGLFSPNGDGILYVDATTGFVYDPQQIGDAGIPPVDQLTQVVVPSQGTARSQNIAILSAFAQDTIPVKEGNGTLLSMDTSDAANAIDGVSEHYYLDGGFDAADTQEQFGFSQMQFWRDTLAGRDPTLPELDFYITEWNVRRTTEVDYGNNRGLQQAALNVEMFYEMVTHDVTVAHFWPSLFDVSRSVSLVCFCRGHLTTAGEAYSQLTQTIGMTPSLDFRDAGNVSIHGFEAGPQALFILSERSGTENTLTLDFSAVRDPLDTLYRVSWSELWDGGAGGQDEAAAQVVIETDLIDLVSAQELDAFLLTMQAWSLVYLNVEAVTDGIAASIGTARRVVSVVTGDDALSLGDIPGEETHHTQILTPRFILNGGQGDDTLLGGAGDDLLDGGAGDDVIRGDLGDDAAVFDTITRASAAFSLTSEGLWVVSALGTDELIGVEWIEFSDQRLRVADVMVEILDDPDVFAVALVQGSILIGTDHNDTLLGQAGADMLSGGLGHDHLEGGGGNDSISASDGDDLVDAGPGRDFIGGGPGNDTIDGGEGDDVIGAGFGDDSALGGNGNDVVAGGAGNDMLAGGAGNDSISGSFGNDLIFGNGDDDDIGGGAGRDTINAGAGHDNVGGGEGDDDILGGDGNDFLAGGGRDDLIDGGTGDDTINGGAGNDLMMGGAGADQFVFSAFFNGERDVIPDFKDGVDRLFIRIVNPATGEANIINNGNGIAGFVEALGIVDTAAGAEMTVNGNTILVEGITAAQLTSDDFLFL
ncbi:calcium-binding protein [Roseovarius sp. 217]|uniref:calcium-binding protein n=1 Tax=Roseovarius sp. (strain 217) TaxID=314264 RepID=UPI0000685969|nr:calcium-binding protein [Roseovarius sp. 217]EAQ26880.1 hypothetical protein ROS217_20177 [Roseovarius sp. 217]